MNEWKEGMKEGRRRKDVKEEASKIEEGGMSEGRKRDGDVWSRGQTKKQINTEN